MHTSSECAQHVVVTDCYHVNRSFTDKKWYCFNDQSVTTVSNYYIFTITRYLCHHRVLRNLLSLIVGSANSIFSNKLHMHEKKNPTTSKFT